MKAVASQMALPPTVLDAASLRHTLLSVSPTDYLIRAGAASMLIAEGEGLAGWVRRIVPENWLRGATLDSQEAAEHSSWTTLLGGLLQAPGVNWLSRAGAISKAENKATQLAVAETLGIRVPRTVITNDRNAVLTMFPGEVVVKPLGKGSFTSGHTGKVLFAKLLDAESLTSDSLGKAPFIFQEHLRALSHWRIVTVNEGAWAARLDARGVSLDWRRDDTAHESFVLGHPPTETLLLAAMIANAFGLGYSSQDWIETSSGFYFLDLNPSGQWLFLPEAVGKQVTASIAAWLSSKGSWGP